MNIFYYSTTDNIFQIQNYKFSLQTALLAHPPHNLRCGLSNAPLSQHPIKASTKSHLDGNFAPHNAWIYRGWTYYPLPSTFLIHLHTQRKSPRHSTERPGFIPGRTSIPGSAPHLTPSSPYQTNSLIIPCAHEESNLDPRLRRPVFCPLNYGRKERRMNQVRCE